MTVRVVQLAAFRHEADLLASWIARARGSSELARMEAARTLYDDACRDGLNLAVLPCVPEHNDFWFFEQLAFTQRYIDVDGGALHAEVGEAAEVLLADSTVIPGPFGRTRTAIDARLRVDQHALCSAFGVSPAVFEVGLPRLGTVLRAPLAQAVERAWARPFHLHGFRLRPDGTRTGMLCNHPRFGGARFLDSLPLDVAGTVDVVLECRPRGNR